MQHIRRNDKQHQQERLAAEIRAAEALAELHLLAQRRAQNRPLLGRPRLASVMGLLTPELAPAKSG